MCDETQNLNETESETFFRYQFFPKPIPILFSIPNFFETDTDTFFSIPKFFETDKDTLKKMEKFRNREELKPRSFETEMSHFGQKD